MLAGLHLIKQYINDLPDPRIILLIREAALALLPLTRRGAAAIIGYAGGANMENPAEVSNPTRYRALTDVLGTTGASCFGNLKTIRLAA